MLLIAKKEEEKEVVLLFPVEKEEMNHERINR